MLLSKICGLVSVERPLWREDGSTICSVITQWPESFRTRNHTLLSHLKLPNLEGQVSVFISPRNRLAQLYPRALGSFYVVPYESQGYGGGTLTLPQSGGSGPRICILQEQDGSKSSYDRRPVNQYILVLQDSIVVFVIDVHSMWEVSMEVWESSMGYLEILCGY
jgi:hypothetical protein